MIIENDFIRIVLDERTGGFVSIFDKEFQHDYILAPDRAKLVRFIIPTPENPSRHVDATQVRIDKIGACGATLRYTLDKIQVAINLQLNDRAIESTLFVHNLSNYIIEETIFPWIRGIGPLENGNIYWPCFWYRRIENPFQVKATGFPHGLGGDHKTWNELLQKVVARYPAHLASAWADYSNEKMGIALEGRHTDFSIMDFFFHKVIEKDFAPNDSNPVRRTLDMTISHPRRVRPEEKWQSPLVRIMIHKGDWHVPAEEHRIWLEKWIKKPERPSKFAEAIGWHFFFMKHQDGHVVFTYEDLPKLAEAALTAGCTYLMLFGWQEGGHDNNYFYRYVPNPAWGGEDALRKALAFVRSKGVEVIPFFNGTLANVEMPEHRCFGYRWEAKTRSGHPYYAGDWARHNFDAPTRNRSMLHHEIAPCREHRAYFLQTAEQIISQFGFGNLQLDQISEKMFVDYNEDHIETTPDRVYVDGLAYLLPRVREILRKENPEGVMVSEVLNDFTGQWCDSSWDWTILMPFPEPILYTLPWLYASHEIDALEYGEVNKAFAYRMHLDLKIDGGDSPISRYPKFAAHIRSLAQLRKTTAAYSVYGYFRDNEGLQGTYPENVLVKTYVNVHTKKVGIVISECEGKPAKFCLTHSWQTSKAITVVSNQNGPKEYTPANTIDILINPYEVQVVCIDLV